MFKTFLFCAALFIPLSTFAETITVKLSQLNNDPSRRGMGEQVGELKFEDSPFGLLIYPEINQFAPGLHGFHIHQNPSCHGKEKNGEYVAGLAAGGHYDPENTGVHLGPYGDGHLGDLPPLYCDEKGTCNLPMLAPRLKVKDIKGHSLMVHVHGDNYSDSPSPLGGGGPRMACGVIH